MSGITSIKSQDNSENTPIYLVLKTEMIILIMQGP